MNELVHLEPTEIEKYDFFTGNGVDTFLAEIKKKVDAFKGDISTKKGQDEIRSAAASIRRVKAAMDEVGKNEVAKLKKLPKDVDAGRKKLRDTMEEYRDIVRKPLTELEEAEKAEALRIQQEEEEKERKRLEDFERREAELKAKEEEIARKEREEEIRKEAEAKAKKEAEEALKKAEQDKIDALEREKQAKIEADARAEAAAQEASRKAAEEAERKERERLAEEQQIKDEEAKRAASKAHQAKINQDALEDIANICEFYTKDKPSARGLAKIIVTAIAKKQIRNVTINY